MVIALIAGLECFYLCQDSAVRAICVAALARLVYENEKVFIHDDQLAAIWNLQFSLNSIASVAKSFPDRIVTIKALGLLCQIYSKDVGLAHHIVDGMLRLKNKVLIFFYLAVQSRNISNQREPVKHI